MERVDQDYLEEILKTSGGDEKNLTNDISVKDDGTTLAELEVFYKL